MAPVPADDGTVLHLLDHTFSIAVFPHLDGETHDAGAIDHGSPSDRQAVIRCIRALHAATSLVAGMADREVFAPPGDLQESLSDLDQPWSGGPYSERARQLLRVHEEDLVAALAFHDELADRAREREEDWVITHGEPTPGNVIWTAHGPNLVDWETAIIAPAARDFWMLETTHVDQDPRRMLYRLGWDLANVGIHADRLRRAPEASGDTIFSWRILQEHIRLPTYRAMRARPPD